ncbi:uracil-DNA glycosylase [Edaphobacter modestus]|uniref:Type-4 uracil-DNA glycosylase n=1 Tax=Edaphobacter modestus TaxID=388466 RepID=A0A4Q7Z004_9BACT|nr:uracil-DNA glycosylase [Edaphobacter modestus]RZU43134.1 DNA polymerase [Edaphobacter modestus]
MAGEAERQLRAYVEYFRDMGVYDLYRRGDPVFEAEPVLPGSPVDALAVVAPEAVAATEVRMEPQIIAAAPPVERPAPPLPKIDFSEPEIPKLVSFDNLAPLPEVRIAAAQRSAALEAIREDIGDCTRCPLAYAGRRNIVFADGDPNARLMFVGEGPGADEDTQGLPFVGKAGQLLNNMISAMGLKREEVYIANIVKCRPPSNRVPEPVEANTCSQFLLRQIDVVQPEVIVALGSTAATYLLGVKQSLSGLRGRWHGCRGAKMVVTYHPAFLLRDPRQKGEAWKDLQMVMKELGLKPPARG